MVCGKCNVVAFCGDCDEQHDSITGTIYPVSHLVQRFSNCGLWTTGGPRVLPLWSF